MKQRAGKSGRNATAARRRPDPLAPVRRRIAPRPRTVQSDTDVSAVALDLPPKVNSETLSVITTSAGQLEPAFETLLGNTTRLCQGKFGILHLLEGNKLRMAGAYEVPPAYIEWRKQFSLIGLNQFPQLPLARVAKTKAVQHVPDLTQERGYVERAPPMVALVEAVGVRSLLCIPMLRGADMIGAIAIYYKEPRPLEEEQIALAKNFATQAVIAIESARQLRALWHELFTGAPTVRLSADQLLFSAGQEGDGCYRVDEGSLKVSVIEPAGDERILAILGPGSVVGELSMIDSAPRSASVLALRDSSLSFVSRVKFESFGQLRPDLYRHLTILLANRLRDTNDSLAATSFLSIKGRLARALLHLADAFGRELGQGRILIRLKVSQGDLAGVAGIARENASRLLQDWASRSLVSRFSGYYCLENVRGLQREAKN